MGICVWRSLLLATFYLTDFIDEPFDVYQLTHFLQIINVHDKSKLLMAYQLKLKDL